jgi:hypothetical protein
MGGEETELCIRAHQHWPEKYFLCEPQARIQHYIPPERASWRYFCARSYAEGVSKALVTRFVGIKDSLSAERAYTFQTLPLALLQALADAFLWRDPTGFLRAGAIIAGLTMATTGYVVGTIFQSRISRVAATRSIHRNFEQSLHPHH